jgi:hypothetical protein
MTVKSADPIDTAQAAVRLEREALSALTLKRAKIDADLLLYSSSERDLNRTGFVGGSNS